MTTEPRRARPTRDAETPLPPVVARSDARRTTWRDTGTFAAQPRGAADPAGADQ